MAASMKVSNANGEFDFAANGCIPVYGRDFEYVRFDPQGPSIKRIKVTLNGIFLGDTLDEIMSQYQELSAILDYNDVQFTYGDGVSAIYSGKQMQIESYSEPQDWKEYDGEFNLELYYYDAHSDSLPIAASYGSYQFESTPSWGRAVDTNRSNQYFLESPSGQAFGKTMKIELKGQLTADNYHDLQAKIDDLYEAFSEDRTLTYGDFVVPVHIGQHSIIEIVPEKLAYFQVALTYQLGDLVSLDIRVRYSRLHRNPVITEMPLCDARIIKLMNLSGQDVDYAISARSTNIPLARSLVSAEVAFLVVPGGIEMPGGSEEWDYTNIGVSVNIKKFHNAYVLSNMQQLPSIFFEGFFNPAG